VQPVAVQVAIVFNAIAVTDHGAERRPWAELVATTEIPWEVMTRLFPTAEKREIYTLKRRIDGLESEVAKLRRGALLDPFAGVGNALPVFWELQ